MQSTGLPRFTRPHVHRSDPGPVGVVNVGEASRFLPVSKLNNPARPSPHVYAEAVEVVEVAEVEVEVVHPVVVHTVAVNVRDVSRVLPVSKGTVYGAVAAHRAACIKFRCRREVD